MEWFIAVLAILVLGVAAMAAAGGMGEMSRDAIRDVYRQQLPDRALTAEDLRKVRFGVTLRGYSMAQVDDLLDRLGNEIAVRDARIAELTGQIQPDAPHAPPLPYATPFPVPVDQPALGEPAIASDDPDAGRPEPIGRRASGWTPDE